LEWHGLAVFEVGGKLPVTDRVEAWKEIQVRVFISNGAPTNELPVVIHGNRDFSFGPTLRARREDGLDLICHENARFLVGELGRRRRGLYMQESAGALRSLRALELWWRRWVAKRRQAAALQNGRAWGWRLRAPAGDVQPLTEITA
jgi:hypothetical protein